MVERIEEKKSALYLRVRDSVKNDLKIKAIEKRSTQEELAEKYIEQGLEKDKKSN